MAVVTVIGEVVLDRFISDNATFEVAGGSSANTALAMHVAGHQVRLRARYSRDDAGMFLKQAAHTAGLNVDESVSASEAATTVDIVLSDSGAPTYAFHMDGTADWQWTRSELDIPVTTGTQAIVTGSLVSVFLPGSHHLFHWAKERRNDGLLLAYDPNARPSAIDAKDAADVRERIVEWVTNSDVVKVSDEDLGWIDPSDTPQTIAKAWSLLGPKLVVLTAGSDGAWAYINGLEVGHIVAPEVEVVDTVGAGDTLMAWLVAGLVDSPENVRFTNTNALAVLERAVNAAAITCTRQGCQPPTQSEVLS